MYQPNFLTLGSVFYVCVRRFAFFVLVLLLCSLVFAQNPNGTLRGEVEDTTGGRIASAHVVVESTTTAHFSREAHTNERGEFRIEGLLPGPYNVTVNATGFADAFSVVSVVVSTVRDLMVTLKPSARKESVTVTGQGSSITTQVIDTASAVHQGTVMAKDLEVVPLAHRSFANIAYLVPGTEPVEPSDPTKARITAVSFGGSSGLNVELSVDGGDNTDDYIGGFLQNFSPDAIQEFAVRTAQEEADTGRTVGGSVVITTKHGTNDWNGTAAFYDRGSALNARYPIDNPGPQPKQPFSRQNYVGAIGGPIAKDRLWTFTSFEYVHENASINYSPQTLTEFNALSSLASQGLITGVNSIPVTNFTAVPFRDALWTLRFDWAQSHQSQWFLRAAIDNYTTNNGLVQQATMASTGAAQGNKYFNGVISNQYAFGPAWLGSFTFDASSAHITQSRNSNLGFALAFPFSATFSTISGFETFGDNQFATPITAFPVVRDQQKYQFRYDLSHVAAAHSPRFGISFIHEPVLSGALSSNAETLITYPNDPSFYSSNPSQFFFDPTCATSPADPNISCTFTPASDGSFHQSVQRLGLYAQDSWRVTSHLTVNYGLRYDTTFGLFNAFGRSQLQNPAYLTLKALQIPLVSGAPHDYRAQFGPRFGIAYSPGDSEKTVIRAGFGLYYNDLAQNGWVSAFQAVNTPPGLCAKPGDPGCIPGASTGGAGSLIDPNYKTPYALHASAGIQHAINSHFTASADWTHENGVHAYQAFNYVPGVSLFSPLFPSNSSSQSVNVPNLTVFRTGNRSNYDALTLMLQGNVNNRFNLTAHYTLASAHTWGCTVGELFDYVDGICNPLNPFGPGDYGPSGEDVRHRFVLAGALYLPAKFEITTLAQFESARPFTIATPVDVNNTGDPTQDRAVINGQQTTLDQFRGTPYMQVDLRVSRPIRVNERLSVSPFIEFFNLFNRNNPGNNYVADISALPTPVNDLANATAFCLNGDCSSTRPISNLNQVKVPAGALGDFFGPGTTVGIPFAAQVGVRVNF